MAGMGRPPAAGFSRKLGGCHGKDFGRWADACG